MDDETFKSGAQPPDSREVSSELLPSSSQARTMSGDEIATLVRKAQQTEEEIALIQRAKRCEEDAWDEIFRLYRLGIARYIAAYMSKNAPNQYKWPGMLKEMVEEKTHETFCRAFWSINNYMPQSTFGAWLQGIAKNVCSEECKLLWQESNLGISHLGALPDYKEPECRDMHEEVLKKELLAQIFHNLPPEELKVVYLHFIKGLKYKEIGELIHQSEGAVKMIISRFRKKLPPRWES